jgi:tetratricopeptide (TPR) repeat protein
VIGRSKKRIESHPKDKYAYWFLAMAYQDKKEYPKALKTLSILKDIAPGWKGQYIEPHIDEIREILRETKPELIPEKD